MQDSARSMKLSGTFYSALDLVRLAGAQGVELMNWLVMRGALNGEVTEIHRNYQAPISNTAGAVMLLEKETVLCR